MSYFWKLLFGVAGELLKSALNRFRDKGAFDELCRIAKMHVSSLLSSDMADADKRNAAFGAIKSDAIKVGLEIKDGLINLALELAYNAIKGAKGE